MTDHNAIAFAFDERAVRVLPKNSGEPRIAHFPDEWKGVTSVVTHSGEVTQ